MMLAKCIFRRCSSLVALLLVILCGTYQKGSAQIMLGAGSSYGDDIDQYAPNLRIYYFPNHKICFGPEFAFFPNTKENGIERRLMEYGFSAHYIFTVGKYLGLYPLLGINYAIETEEYLDLHEEKTSLGANLGAGFHLEFGNYFPYVEYKYVASDLAQNVFSIGVLVTINKGGKKEHHE